MNVPFKFTMTSANDVHALWNPWGVTTGIDGNNEILTALVDPAAAQLLPPPGSAFITHVLVQTDGQGDAKVTFGYWDTVTGAFVALLPVLATDVAGGGFDGELGEGMIPCGETKVPAVRYDGSAGGVVAGQVRVFFAPDVSGGSDSGGYTLQHDENGAILLDENNFPVYESN